MAEPVILNAQGVTRLTLAAGVTAKVGSLIGPSGATWVLADADARVPAQYMAMQYGLAEEISVCVSGVLWDSDAPYAIGADQYLSATAGAHGAAPALSTTLTVLQRIGVALTTKDLAFDLSPRGPTILRAQATVNPGSIPAVSTANVAVTLTGIANDDVIDGIPPTAFELMGIQRCHASTDTITIRLFNASASAVDPASATWTFYVQRF